jgi:hypothetical protein
MKLTKMGLFFLQIRYSTSNLQEITGKLLKALSRRKHKGRAMTTRFDEY